MFVLCYSLLSSISDMTAPGLGQGMPQDPTPLSALGRQRWHVLRATRLHFQGYVLGTGCSPWFSPGKLRHGGGAWSPCGAGGGRWAYSTPKRG